MSYLGIGGYSPNNIVLTKTIPNTSYYNYIINGNFDIWQRAISQTSDGYGSDDRWSNGNVGSSKTHSQQTFTPGQTDVPGNPTYFSRTVVSSVLGANNYVIKGQNIENVAVLSGKKITITFYAKADTIRNIALELYQVFGSGGSSPVSTPLGLISLTTSWKRYDILIDVPSVSGKTIGLNNCLSLQFWLDGGSNFSTRSSNLGQQSGTFDIAHVSLVEGDMRKEQEPFTPRQMGIEQLLCYRYYFKGWLPLRGVYSANNSVGRLGAILPQKMRTTPTVGITGLVWDGQNASTLTGITASYLTDTAIEIDANINNTNGVVGRACIFYYNGSGSIITIDAEL